MADFWVTEAMNGFGMTVQVTEELCSKRSEFQKIDVYQTSKLGRMLLLDGIIQLTEFDEFAYHEMLAHIPLFAHENPKRLLVVGGGDGGVLREAGKHPELEVMDICEIDAEVIETAKKFFRTSPAATTTRALRFISPTAANSSRTGRAITT